MYLIECAAQMPALRLRLDEPMLLKEWGKRLPINAMTLLWKLDFSLQMEWFNHFADNILNPNYRNAVVTASGDLRGGAVNNAQVIPNRSFFRGWMNSSQEPELFATVKLKKFAENSGLRSALMLAPDVLCLRCDHTEPAWLHLGTDTAANEFHPDYRFVGSVLKTGMFDTYLEMTGCIKCSQTKYSTPNMRIFGRYRPRRCECMPCRRELDYAVPSVQESVRNFGEEIGSFL